MFADFAGPAPAPARPAGGGGRSVRGPRAVALPVGTGQTENPSARNSARLQDFEHIAQYHDYQRDLLLESDSDSNRGNHHDDDESGPRFRTPMIQVWNVFKFKLAHWQDGPILILSGPSPR